MTQLEVTVKLSLKGLEKFKRDIKKGTGSVKVMLKRWAFRYRGFVQRRFDQYSKGGGNWPPLAPSTIARRKKGSGKGKVAILRDTGLLFNALAPVFQNSPGSLEEYEGLSVLVGYGGASSHGNSSKTIADIAAFHDLGNGVPKRQIIVVPNEATLKGMKKDAEKLLGEGAKKDIEGQ